MKERPIGREPVGVGAHGQGAAVKIPLAVLAYGATLRAGETPTAKQKEALRAWLIDLPAPVVAVVAVPEKAKPKKPPKPQTIYVVDVAVFGGPRAKAILVDLDAAPVPLSALDFEMCLSALAVIRAEAQHHEGAPTYRAAECAHLRAILGAHKPTSIGRAITNAATEPFWAAKTLGMDVVARHIASWLTLGRPAEVSPTGRKSADGHSPTTCTGMLDGVVCGAVLSPDAKACRDCRKPVLRSAADLSPEEQATMAAGWAALRERLGDVVKQPAPRPAVRELGEPEILPREVRPTRAEREARSQHLIDEARRRA